MDTTTFQTTMLSRKLNMENNNDVNIWHAYKTKLINSLTLIPMSFSPTRTKADKSEYLHRFMMNFGDRITYVRKEELFQQRRNLEQQFRNLKSPTGPVHYVNDPGLTIDLALPDGHDTSSITQLSQMNRYMLNQILRRADYHSAIKLVRNVSDHSMVSVIASRLLHTGTAIVDYGGVHHLAVQLKLIDHLEHCSKSITWEVLKHSTDNSRDILLHPVHESNIGRCINGTRVDEQHRANCVVVKVCDDDGYVHILILAIRDILPGEHLFYSYGDKYFTTWVDENNNLAEFFTIEQMQNLIWEEVPLV